MCHSLMCTFAVNVDLRLLPYLGHEEPLNPWQISIPGILQELLLWLQLLHGPLQGNCRGEMAKCMKRCFLLYYSFL